MRQGFLAFQHLAWQDGWCVFWADPFHKAARKCSAAIRATDGGQEFVTKIMKLFRYTRGTFKTSKFGKIICEARSGLLDLLQREKDHPVLDPWLCGMSRDVESPFQGKDSLAPVFDRQAAIDCLLAQKGIQTVPSDCACQQRQQPSLNALSLML